MVVSVRNVFREQISDLNGISVRIGKESVESPGKFFAVLAADFAIKIAQRERAYRRKPSADKFVAESSFARKRRQKTSEFYVRHEIESLRLPFFGAIFVPDLLVCIR